jgi:S-formylglutathione hydrolase FrmB
MGRQQDEVRQQLRSQPVCEAGGAEGLEPHLRRSWTAVCAVAALTLTAGLLAGQTGTAERIKVHGKSLEGNLSGDSADRDVSIYLPPSYKTERNRRYPVVYMLHGFTDDDERWFGFRQHWINLKSVLDKALAGGATKEMIVVMPNAYTKFAGSMYSSSVTTGDWERYVSVDLVEYVDSHYRTMPTIASRGLAGHSMGGYGTLRIGMKRPDVFSSIYALNPCCLGANINPPGAGAGGRGGPSRAETVRDMEEFAKADFGTKAAMASAAAWSPNPGNPPFFFDLTTREGQWQPAVAAKWAANAPLAMVDQYVFNLKRLRAIGFDAGTQEGGISATARLLDEALKKYGIAHAFEIYEGNHTNRVAERIETMVMPFFSTNLSFSAAKR